VTDPGTNDPTGEPSPSAPPPPPAPPAPRGEPEAEAPSGVPRPARSFGVGALLAASVVSAALSSAVAVIVTRASLPGADSATTHAPEKGALYTCPMHPSIVQDHPGTCPICGMKLVPLDKPPKSDAPSAAPAERKIIGYRSPMNPRQTSPVPRKDEMGMDYLPVYEEAAQPSDPAPVLGLATAEVDLAQQQLIGLRTATVTRGAVGGAWRTVGRIVVDETRVRRVNVKVSGFVERVYVDYVGKTVKRGDPLFTMYSPELFAAQEEYLLAKRLSPETPDSGAPSRGDTGLAAAARRKLELWDVPQGTIEQLQKTGQPTKALTVYSPIAGVVTTKDVVEGAQLPMGAMPYEVADLSTVWVVADVYECDLRFVKENMPATLTLAAFPNRELKGKVVFLPPTLDPQTRTIKARLTFPNPTGDLRPEMFGDVVLLGAPHEGLRVPNDAVIDAGTRKVAFVGLGDGKFQPRIVKTGASDGTYVEVLSGLVAGESVVVRANFLVDSESRLRASLADMTGTGAKRAPERARVLPETLAPMGGGAEAGAGHTGRTAPEGPTGHTGHTAPAGPTGHEGHTMPAPTTGHEGHTGNGGMAP